MTEALIGVGAVLFLNLCGFVYLFGRLNEKVNGLGKSLNGLKNHLSEINKRLDNIAEKVSWIEGKLGVSK